MSKRALSALVMAFIVMATIGVVTTLFGRELGPAPLGGTGGFTTAGSGGGVVVPRGGVVITGTLGVGTSSLGTDQVRIEKDWDGTTSLRVRNTTSGASARTTFLVTGAGLQHGLSLATYSAGYTDTALAGYSLVFSWPESLGLKVAAQSGNLGLYTGTITDTNERMVIGSTGGVTVNTYLALGSGVFDGPVQFGMETGVVTGTCIAHGFATTPTAVVATIAGCCFVNPVVVSVNTITATNFCVCITPTETVNLYWMAGK